MKLFQRLLVAPAALGLLAPISANANEVNLKEISNYSDLENFEVANSFNNDELIENTLLAGGEGLVDDHSHDGGFSSTTSASFSADLQSVLLMEIQHLKKLLQLTVIKSIYQHHLLVKMLLAFL